MTVTADDLTHCFSIICMFGLTLNRVCDSLSCEAREAVGKSPGKLSDCL